MIVRKVVLPVVVGGGGADVLGFSVSFKKETTHVDSVRMKTNDHFFSGKVPLKVVKIKHVHVNPMQK